MATISELMENDWPGTAKISRPSWDSDKYWSPFFINSDGEWVGIDVGGLEYRVAADEYSDWQIWSPPEKKKKVLYQWLIKLKSGWYPTPFYHETAEELMESHKNMITRDEVRRLDHTAVEVDDA